MYSAEVRFSVSYRHRVLWYFLRSIRIYTNICANVSATAEQLGCCGSKGEKEGGRITSEHGQRYIISPGIFNHLFRRLCDSIYI